MRFSSKVVNSFSEFRGLDIILPQWILCLNKSSKGREREERTQGRICHYFELIFCNKPLFIRRREIVAMRINY